MTHVRTSAAPRRPLPLVTLLLVAACAAASSRSSAQTSPPSPSSPSQPSTPIALTVAPEVVGRSPALVGYGQGHYLPGSNTSAWLQRSGANSWRVFMNAAYFAPQDDLAPFGDGVSDAATFEARRAAVLADPENPAYINWATYEQSFRTVRTRGNVYELAYMMGELRRLGIRVIVNTQHCTVNNATTQTNPRDWRHVSHSPSWMPISIHTDYADKWEFWKWHFVSAYWLAKYFDVTDFQIWNEPDHVGLGGNISQEDYLEWLRYAADAKRAAVAAVNARFGKHLAARIYAPVMTSGRMFHARLDNADTRDDVTGWGELVSRHLYTNYKGEGTTTPLFDVFDLHRYQDDAEVYAQEMDTLQTGMAANTPDGRVLPIDFSEHNVENTSTFARTGDNLDMPRLFTELAQVYLRTMEHGVYGLQAFKFSRVDGSEVGFHDTWEGPDDWDIGGYRKGASVLELFARGFAGGRPLLRTTVAAGGDGSGGTEDYGGAATSATADRYYIWSVNRSETQAAALRIDVAALDVHPQSPWTIEEVSAARSGEVVLRGTAHAGKTFTATQPPQSVWLISVPRGGRVKTAALAAAADAEVQGGANASQNVGRAETLHVRLGPTADDDRAALLKFDLRALRVPPQAAASVRSARLVLCGVNAADEQPFLFDLYGLTDDGWREETITWATAPGLDPARAKAVGVGTTMVPIGVMTVDAAQGPLRRDVTAFVRARLAVAGDGSSGGVGDGQASFVLLRAPRFDGDTADAPREATIVSRDSRVHDASSCRPSLEIDR